MTVTTEQLQHLAEGTDSNPDSLLTYLARRVLAAEKMAESLEWLLSESETNRGDIPLPDYRGRTWNEINAYWIEGENKASEALAAFRNAIEVK